MCELLVFLVDKVNADPYLDAGCHKAGDVIAVLPDGHEWGREEVANPNWKIVKVPGVSVEDATGFVAAEVKESDGYLLRPRAFKYDLAANPTDLASLMAAKSRKPLLPDPNVLGQKP